MPLRNHFHRPQGFVDWYSVQALWTVVCIQHLNRTLPTDYAGLPVRCRGQFADPPAEDEHAIHVVVNDPDNERLVASVEFVSARNKDRPESRRMFVAKCAGLLNQGVCVSIVDCVTNAHFNLYTDLLDFLGHTDPHTAGPPVPHVYAVTLRKRKASLRWRMEKWMHQLQIGQPLPTLPLWLSGDVCLPLDLEATYEEACRTVRLPE